MDRATPHQTIEILSRKREDEYIHEEGSERTSPSLVDKALRVHAIGYTEDMEFVSPDAIGDDGYLLPEIDKARGPNVEYHLATHRTHPGRMATMRIVHLIEGEGAKDLPGYQLIEQALSTEHRDWIRGIDGSRLKELAGFAKSDKAASQGLYEIIRKTIQQALGKNETWLFAIVATTHEALAHRLGEQSFKVLGEDVPINDDRVNQSKVKLRPVSFRPDDFFSNMYDIITGSETDELTRQTIMASLLFFTKGVEDQHLDGNVAELRSHILGSVGDLTVRLGRTSA